MKRGGIDYEAAKHVFTVTIFNYTEGVVGYELAIETEAPKEPYTGKPRGRKRKVTEEEAAAVVKAVQSAPEEVRESFEEEINVFGGQFDEYVPVGSAISVAERRTVVAVTVVSSVIAVSAASAPPAPSGPSGGGSSGGSPSGDGGNGDKPRRRRRGG